MKTPALAPSTAFVPKETVALLLLLGVVFLLPILAAGSYVYAKHHWAQARMQELEPRYARLVGLDQQRDALAEATQRAHTMHSWYLHPLDKDANQTGNEIQERVRSILSSAGMGIVSSQVLPAKQDKGLEHIAIAVRADGDITSLQGALMGLAEQKPALLVDDVHITAQGGDDKGPQRLAVQLNVLALRGVQP